MSILSIRFQESSNPLVLAEQLRLFLGLDMLSIDHEEGYSKQIERVSSLLKPSEARSFPPLQVLMNNAARYGPHYGLTMNTPKGAIEGYINRTSLHFILDPEPDELLRDKLLRFCKAIDGATIELVDDLGKSLPIG